MCGRYSIFDEEDIIEMKKIISEVDKRFSGTPERERMKTSGEIFPSDTVPVVLPGEEGKLRAEPLMWGFPRWNGGGLVINARSETAAEKNMFARSLALRRCVLPSTGFYEWERRNGTKTKNKYLFTAEGSKMLYMAGVYNTFSPAGAEGFTGFVILTEAAADPVAEIHDRMPVILRPSELLLWLFDPQSPRLIFEREPPALTAKKL